MTLSRCALRSAQAFSPVLVSSVGSGESKRSVQVAAVECIGETCPGPSRGILELRCRPTELVELSERGVEIGLVE